MDEIENKVKSIIGKQLGIKIEDIHNESRFVHDIKGDSLDTVEILLTIEDEFNIEVDEQTAESVETVQMVIDFVKSLQKTG
jgi:acyl carrier protein